MKAIIFHGTDDTPESYWYPWLRRELEHRGFSVEVPHYSDINHVPADKFVPKVLQEHTFDEETVLIGHSAGGPLILSILEQIKQKVAQAVLVAGFSAPLPNEDVNIILQSSYDWPRIKAQADDFVFFNSDNDPWGCDDVQGRALFDNLGGTLIIRHDGHFGSASNNQPYEEFPLLLKTIKGAEV